ncbi:MAG: anaerobic glycerol-3-phosphate dehydrogenase subunit C [Planctomycetota bacterium]|jgi:glycerol-3-phosphate dehydrogenase subunit C
MSTVYSIHDERYWDRDDLEEELTRVYDICHGCRMCFNLCPSFPALFDAVDAHDDAGEGEVDALTEEERWKVVDECFQCKICYVKCPYTPDDGHAFNLDFPRLMLRAEGVRAKEQGVPFRERMAGNTDRLGKLMCAFAPVSNFLNRRKSNRFLMEKTVGISRKFKLPTYFRETFLKWWRKNRRNGSLSSGENGKVAFFATCTVNYSQPHVGRAAVEVLERSGVDVVVPEQECCGMPFLDAGAFDLALTKMRRNAEALAAEVKEGRKIVVPGPTCSYLLRKETADMVGTEDARLVAENTMDLCEYLMSLHKEGKLPTGFAKGAGTVAYHAPCHLRAQNIGLKSRDLLMLLPDTKVVVIEQCSGVDGTWGMKAAHYDAGMKVARKLLRGIDEAKADVVATDCPLAALRIEQHTGRPPIHPVEVVREAYGDVPVA